MIHRCYRDQMHGFLLNSLQQSFKKSRLSKVGSSVNSPDIVSKLC